MKWDGVPEHWGRGAYRDIPISKYVRMCRERHVNDLKRWQANDPNFPFYFDWEASEHAVWFLGLLRQFEGRFYNQPLILSDWQEWDLIRPLFGWKRLDGRRRFDEATVVIPRKNGKSTIAGAIADYMLVADKEYGAQIVTAAALCLETEIPMAEGWKTVRDLEIGDSLFDEKGNPTKIIGLTEVFYDHDCYRLTFDDGTKVIADGGHRWKTRCTWMGEGQSRSTTLPELKRRRANAYFILHHKRHSVCKWNDPFREEKFRQALSAALDQNPLRIRRDGIKTTEEIYRTQLWKGRANHSIRVTDPLHICDKALLIDPYVLGIWLGDGNSQRGSIVAHPNDIEVIENVRSRGYEVTQMKARDSLWSGTIRGIRSALGKLRLLGNKHIPEIYLRASLNQRLELLRGLMDTDGTCTKNGECRFSNSNGRLAEGVYELAQTLGLKAHIRKIAIQNPNKNTAPFHWIISFKAYDDFPVFNLTRKRNRQIKRTPQSSKTTKRYITNVEKIPCVPVKCISVDSPNSLFLATRSFIPTHNTKEDQARITWDYGRKMMERSPELRGEFKAFRKSVVNEELGSRFFPLGKDSDTQDGLNVHFGLIDEYHAHKNADMRNVVLNAMAMRDQPLLMIITTLGYIDSSPCDEEFALACSILDGRIQNEHYFAFVATVDDPEKWQEESEWYKANPNLGITIDIERFRADFEKAQLSPRKREDFKCKRLNIKGKRYGLWISADKYQEGGVEIDWSKFRGKRCFAGLDLGITRDISALCLAFLGDEKVIQGPDGKLIQPNVYVMMKYWVAEDSLRERYEEDGVPYPQWAEEGWITTTPGNATRYDLIRRDINALAGDYEIAEIAIDRAHAHQLMTDLADDGFTIVKHAQTMLAMNFPCRSFEELILENRLRHGGDPVLRWMVGNVAIVTDGNENIKIMKDRSGGRVDGVVASCMAIGRLLIAPEPTNFVYNSMGMYTG